MNERETKTNQLDQMFEAARREPPEADAAFLNRLVHDARAQNPGGRPAGTTASSGRTTSFWQSLGANIGGWPSLAGLATAAAAGVVIGVTVPETSDALDLIGLGTDQYDLLIPGYDDLDWNEG